ncbi:maleylpyruvate isomerase family mycothiol-dependent enzyme [Streptomyces sp. NBS 14/10]|uniref:maleylpyruvate isomerase family mycothiol-dependent enzyme n=1 Tax=Streptomyces sp. NBS 14/10 TaxID=1945643 RepID=UPI000B7DE743|nr:maleylpyruvate isomerase family mycothiol-dependent enzyme [Streptomyces sp. NBS 14/10]KAK1184618.1 maleylpyruvate isomerase family mycothiol-dependent enzyme [Streptomyces sp. NBS 14/10]
MNEKNDRTGADGAARVVAAVLDGHQRLRTLLDGLTEAAVREPSALPGWSRAHVLAHLGGVASALARQARFAMQGELIEVYDGGRPARDAAMAEALAEAEGAFTAVGPRDWERPVRYRDSDVRGVLLCWWRELEIHTADALLGPGPGDWSREFCAHALDFLAPRAPLDARLTLEATDGPERRTYGAGVPLTVRGRLADLTAWLAGRTPAGPLDSGPAPLPELRPWP